MKVFYYPKNPRILIQKQEMKNSKNITRKNLIRYYWTWKV